MTLKVFGNRRVVHKAQIFRLGGSKPVAAGIRIIPPYLHMYISTELRRIIPLS